MALPDTAAPFFHNVYQLVQVDGFAEVVIHAFGEALFPVFRGSIGGHRYDQRLYRTGSPYDPGRFQSIHFGHLYVHKDEVELFFSELVQHFFSVLGDLGVIAHFVQYDPGKLLVDDIVFGQEDPEGVFSGKYGQWGGRSSHN